MTRGAPDALVPRQGSTWDRVPVLSLLPQGAVGAQRARQEFIRYIGVSMERPLGALHGQLKISTQ